MTVDNQGDNSSNLPTLSVTDVYSKLRFVYVKVSHLNSAEIKCVIQTYLSYLLYCRAIKICSVSELRVFMYQLSNIPNEKLDGDNPPRAMQEDSGCVKKYANEPGKTIYTKSNNYSIRQTGDKKHLLAKMILSPNGSSLAYNLKHPPLEKEYFNHVNEFLSYSEQSYEVAVNEIVDKLLSVINEQMNSTKSGSLIEKLHSTLFRSRWSGMESKYQLIKAYRRKGLFVSDFKKVYMSELIRNVCGEKHG